MNRFIIQQTTTIKDSLVILNQISSETQSLLVVDEDKKMVGTLTDGDIRRGLISGAELSDSVSTIMHKDFKFIFESEYDVALVRKLCDKKILFIPVLDKDYHIVDVLNLKKMKSYLPIDAVLMAGGKGERLRPLTENTPKPLLTLGNKVIIDYIVEHIISFGIKHISVTTNYLHEQIDNHFSTPIHGIQVHTVLEPKFLGTIGSIRYIQKFHHDTVLLMNSDAITDIDLEDFYLHFKEHDADMSIATIPYSISIPYGILELDGRIVKGVKEKPTYNYYANTGIYLIKRELLDLIPDDEMFHATHFMEMLLRNEYKVIRFPFNGIWIDIGNPQEYKKAQELIKHF